MSVRVLVVEDEVDICGMLVRLAGSEGHLAIGAADGAEAVSLINTNEFDFILLDLALPEVDGVSVAKHLRRVERAEARRPAYVLGNTGYGQYVAARGTFARAGIDKLLEKPLDPAEIVKLMRSEAERRG